MAARGGDVGGYVGGYGDEAELGNLNPASWLACYYSDWYRVTVELPLLLHIQFFSLGITRDRAKRLTRDTVQKMDSTNDLSNTVQAENKQLEIDLRPTTTTS